MQTPSRLTFAAALIGLAALTFVYGDFTLQWQPVPAWVPDRRLLALPLCLDPAGVRRRAPHDARPARSRRACSFSIRCSGCSC